MGKVFMNEVSDTVHKKKTSLSYFFTELGDELSGEIDSSIEALSAYSTDNSSFTVVPQAIVYPKTVHDIKQCISFAKQHEIPLVTRGSGHGGSGGCLGEGIIIDMSRHFNIISHIDIKEGVVTVDAGVTIQDLQRNLSLWGMEVPLFVDDDDKGTVGGFFATRSITSSTFRYGSVREWVEAVTVVLSTGEEHLIKSGVTLSGQLLDIYEKLSPYIQSQSGVLRAAKPENIEDATGYNIWDPAIGSHQLLNHLAGSEGTLGIITSITFKVSKKKEYAVTTAIPIPTIELLTSCITIATHHRAHSLFIYDTTYEKLIKKYHPGILFENNTEKNPFTLLIQHTNNDLHMLHRDIATCIRSLPIDPTTIFTLEEKKARTLRSQKFLNSITNTREQENEVAIKTVRGGIVPIHNYLPALQEVISYMKTTSYTYTFTGYAGSGHIALTTLFERKDFDFTKKVLSYTENLFIIFKKNNGGISACGGDGIMNTPYLPFLYGETVCDVFKVIKQIWDPYSIFNPGKKVYISKRYIQEHLSATG